MIGGAALFTSEVAGRAAPSLALQPQQLQPSVGIRHHKAAAVDGEGVDCGVAAAVAHVRDVRRVNLDLRQRASGVRVKPHVTRHPP